MALELLEKLRNKSIQFTDVLSYIESNYDISASAFVNGNQENAENQNQGSAKVLSFAKLNDLSEEDTLLLFAEHYQAVLDTPDGIDHQNIRQFMISGWDGVKFDKTVLVSK